MYIRYELRESQAPISWAMIVKSHSSEIEDIHVAVQRAVSISKIPLESHQISLRQRMAACSEPSSAQS
jgi:hypothetical protein